MSDITQPQETPVIDSQALAVLQRGRWFQLCAGILCMIVIANMQYGWTLFVGPMDAMFHWGKAPIQVAFTIFVVCETWPIPLLGYIIDSIGPSRTTLLGSVMIAIGWWLCGVATNLPTLYTGAVFGGLGAGFIYSAAVGNALRWFPDRRGLAAGLTAAGFGAGAALSVSPMVTMIAEAGYQHTFIVFGVGQGVAVFFLALLLRQPPAELAASKADTGAWQAKPLEVVRSPIFWLMYLMFVLVATGGLMATAQLATIAKDFGVADTNVMILGFSGAALPFAMKLDRVLNGLTRPFFGWISDKIGRENTMFIAFLIEGIGIFSLMSLAHDPVLFVLLTGIVFFAWGEIYSLFPATLSDTFGTKFANSNYGLLYTAKGTAALSVGLGPVLVAWYGSWDIVFVVASLFNILAALLALVVLKPWRRRVMAAQGAGL